MSSLQQSLRKRSPLACGEFISFPPQIRAKLKFSTTPRAEAARVKEGREGKGPGKVGEGTSEVERHI